MVTWSVTTDTLVLADLDPPTFIPSGCGVIINSFFSVSLALSLLASFGALVGQQWLIYYTKPRVRLDDGWRWDEVRKLHGAHSWKLSLALEFFLPIVLQVALVIFLLGFVEFMYELSSRDVHELYL